MKVIKSYAYNIINAEPFEIPFPLVFELLSGNTLLAEYTISEAGVVDYSFNPNTSEKILTSIMRPLTLNDIYFLFTTRIFPDRTPYTQMEMERFGIIEYQPYLIIRRTRGMLPGDKYWFRFEGETLNYKHALQEHRNYYENSYNKYVESLEAAQSEEQVKAAASAMENPQGSKGEIPEQAAKILENNSSEVMTDEMISSLMNSLGDELDSAPEASEKPAVQPTESGGSDKMSDDAIAALLSANQAPEEPTPTSTSSGSDKMSDDAIAALLAANQA
ncbi:MAG: hypothetical protein FWG44_04050 [Oscillospiraceae bacterium]|nr:hypothetical protein [Oscillospiraceae bacterium]